MTCRCSITRGSVTGLKKSSVAGLGPRKRNGSQPATISTSLYCKPLNKSVECRGAVGRTWRHNLHSTSGFQRGAWQGWAGRLEAHAIHYQRNPLNKPQQGSRPKEHLHVQANTQVNKAAVLRHCASLNRTEITEEFTVWMQEILDWFEGDMIKRS